MLRVIVILALLPYAVATVIGILALLVMAFIALTV